MEHHTVFYIVLDMDLADIQNILYRTRDGSGGHPTIFYTALGMDPANILQYFILH